MLLFERQERKWCDPFTISSNWKGDEMNETTNHVDGSCHRSENWLRLARNLLVGWDWGRPR
jgi:hypothetical protein